MEDTEYYKQQLLETQQKLAKTIQELDEEKSSKSESIAIIGMAMRLPGKIKNAKDLWNVLINGIDCIEEIPANRWDKDALYNENPSTPGKLYLKEGGFIEDIEYLDGPFFNISPIELESTDPQQRILLEVTHEAFENAGIDVNSLVGSDTGVFIGIDNVDYVAKHYRSKDYKLINGYCYTSTGPTGASGRISYTMGLRGPCFTLDTACSSSLTCTHVAIQSLKSKDCKIAVVGGSNLILEPDLSLALSMLNALSPDARCKSFDDNANGYVRSEGVSVMILKRLSDAQKDNDNILAIIKGSAINQDGKSRRFTAPSTVAQGMLHTAALKNAQLHPTEIDYYEAHGTGTKIGDPAEIRGLMFAYEKYRSLEKPLLIGAIKSNIGHMECNAGMANMFKIILSLQKNIIPQSIHVKQLNTLVDWDNIPLKVTLENTPWIKNASQPRYAGTSVFGITGSNAHVIIGDAPENKKHIDKLKLRNDIYVLPISAKSEQALLDLAKVYADFIQDSEHALEDICAMAALRRAHFDLRETFVSTSKEELIEKLLDFASNNTYESKKKFDTNEKIKTIFVFPGQGSQWYEMGKTLLENEPVFKSALEECSRVFSKYVDWNLLEEIAKPENESRLNEIDIVQPVLIAIEIALANLWMSKGVFPDVVIGHSMGEIAAAYVAGNISLDDASKIIITRSKLMKQLSGKGEMGATDLTVDEANELLKGYEDKLSVAVMNSKNSTVISGEPNALNEVFVKLETQGRFNRKVKVDVASHSPQMDSITEELRNTIQTIRPQNSSIQFYSTAKNQLINGEDLDADYWTKNLRNAVQFGNAILENLKENQAAFIEMSPHPLLVHAINENINEAAKNGVAVSSFLRDKNELIEFYNNIGELDASGFSIDWKSIYPNIGDFVELPNYAWQKERYWFDTKPEIATFTNGQETNLNNDVSKNLYEINWQEIKLDNTISAKNILIIKDTYGYFAEVEKALKEKGCNVTSIDFADSLDNIKADLVIHMRSFYTESIFNFYLECGILSLQKLIKHFNETNQHPKICVITNGSFLMSQDKNANINASMLTGVLRTLENEHEEINFLQIDISNEINQQEINEISSLVFAENKYKELALRHQIVYTSNIQQQNTTTTKSKEIFTDKTYIVTGGNNGMGFETVKWLINKGAKNIAVISRSGFDEKNKTIIDEFTKDEILIKSYLADVANEQELKNVVNKIRAEQAEINGVFHAAGILDDGMFENLTKEKFINATYAKSIGAWNLHLLFPQNELDFFVVFSSGSSILGTSGQSNYAAANSFLDALVNYRRNNNQNGLSVNWGTIAEIGLAAQQDNRANRLAEQGITTILPSNLFNYFDTLFLSDAKQLMAIEIDFNKWSKFNHAILKNNFYYKVINQTTSTIVENKEEKPNFVSVEDYKKHIKSKIKQHISSATKLGISKIKEDETFKNLGVDSLHALQLKNKIQEDFNLQLNVAAIWQYPTVQKFADFIAKELNIEAQFSEEKKEIEVELSTIKNDVETEVKNLSLEELMKELSSKLD